MSGLLDGVKVIDAGLLVQGPQCAAYLGHLGAEVIKIELPNFGDQSRYILLGPTDFRSAYYAACNRGKKSVTLDLRTEQGSAILKRLVEDADVLVSNFKPGTLEEWGLGYEDLEKVNPRLIWAAGSTFGPTGPDSHREGADLAAQCAGGLVSTTGSDGEAPSPVGVTIADHIGALNMACGILAALHARATTGKGQKVEVSLLGGQIWAQASEFTHYLMTEQVPGRSNFGHPLILGTYRIFETADGWLGLIGVPPDTFDDFLISMERTDLLLDARFHEPGYSPEKRNWFNGELATTFKTRSTESWCKRFAEIGVRYAPVNDYAATAQDEGVKANGYIQDLDEFNGSKESAVAPPLHLNDSPLQVGGTVPQLGEHTNEILEGLGLTAEEIETLRDENVV